MGETHLSDKNFADFNLPSPLLKGISEAGFTFCTPIQAETLAITLAGKDVAGQAQTGTGKTAAFLITMLARLLSSPAPEHRKPSQPRGFILAPTRELAIQIYNDAQQLGKHCDQRIGIFYGGEGHDKQRQQFEGGIDILIGTPGRVIDYFKQHLFDLRAVEIAVLDEADRMFDLGFIRDIRFLLRRMPAPEKRLTMLYSATLSYRVVELSYEHMNNPEMIRIAADKTTADNVRQSIYYTSNEEKIPLLIGLLTKHDYHRTIIFINTKEAGRKIHAWLTGNGFDAGVLSGDVPQNKRLRLLQRFQKGELPILVATDVAARGLHIPEISHVINFDLPQDAEDYVHRIGRTARAGASGDAISFACEDYAFSLPEIEEYISHKIEVHAVSIELLSKPSAPIFAPREKSTHTKSRSSNRGTSKKPGHSQQHRRKHSHSPTKKTD